jgi:hypothetical protein
MKNPRQKLRGDGGSVGSFLAFQRILPSTVIKVELIFSLNLTAIWKSNDKFSPLKFD